MASANSKAVRAVYSDSLKLVGNKLQVVQPQAPEAETGIRPGLITDAATPEIQTSDVKTSSSAPQSTGKGVSLPASKQRSECVKSNFELQTELVERQSTCSPVVLQGATPERVPDAGLSISSAKDLPKIDVEDRSLNRDPIIQMAPKNKKSKWIPNGKIPRKNKVNDSAYWKQEGETRGKTFDEDEDILDEFEGLHELADWDGGWAPARPDWDSRTAFVDPLITKHIEKWNSKASENLDPIAVGEGNQVLKGEIASRSWVPDNIDDVSAEKWWAEHLREPGVDQLAKPWWATYVSPTSEELAVQAVPEARVDPLDNDMTKIHQTGESSILLFENKKLRRIDNTRKQREIDLERKLAIEESLVTPRAHPYAPKIDIHLRAAKVEDLDQIKEIYNQFVERDVSCPEIDPLSKAIVRERWSNVQDEKLPFVVAVEQLRLGGRGKKPVMTEKTDHILGYAFAEDYHDMMGVYRYVVELEMFVRPEYQKYGIGRCLMDKMMSILDPSYEAREGYHFLTSETRFAPGGAREVKSIIINILHTGKDAPKLDWILRWLAQWNFLRVGNLDDIGEKLNQRVTQTILLRKCGQVKQ